MRRDQWPPGGRNDGGPATVGKAGPTSNQNQPPPSTRFNRQPSAPARHFHAAGLRRREAALRLPPIGRCGCIRDPDHDRHLCRSDVTEKQAQAAVDAARHLTANGYLPLFDRSTLVALWRRPADRDLAERLHELCGRVVA